jgi:hypothetical protein
MIKEINILPLWSLRTYERHMMHMKVSKAANQRYLYESRYTNVKWCIRLLISWGK